MTIPPKERLGVPSKLKNLLETETPTHSSHGDKDFHKEPGQGVLDVLVFNLQEIMCAFLGNISRTREGTGMEQAQEMHLSKPNILCADTADSEIY